MAKWVVVGKILVNSILNQGAGGTLAVWCHLDSLKVQRAFPLAKWTKITKVAKVKDIVVVVVDAVDVRLLPG